MLRVRFRAVPHIMRACLESLTGVKTTLPPSTFTSTCSLTSRCSSPNLPLAESRRPASCTVTPAGTVTGFLPTRDIVESSINPAEDLAADVGGTGLVVRHDAARRRQDRNPQTVVDARQIGDARIDATPRLGHPADLADDRLAFVVLQLDPESGLALLVRSGREVADVALALQHVQHVRAQLRRRAQDARHLRLLPVADARQQI